MKPAKHPSEIARAALKLLATRKQLPTPVNYRECYCEIAQTPNLQWFPEDHLRHIALALTARSTAQQEQLNRLDGAIGRHSWQGVESALIEFVTLGVPSGSGAKSEDCCSAADGASNTARDYLTKLASMIERILPALVDDDEDLAKDIAALLQILRNPETDIQKISHDLDIFARRLSFAAEQQAEIKQALLSLLHLVIENISKLILEDKWLEGQVAALLDAVKPPLSLRRLDDVARRIRDVMHKQAAAKERSLEAQAEIRQMLGTFIERLSVMNESSAMFQGRMEDSVRQLEQIRTVEDLAPLLREVIGATRTMAEDTSRAREELSALQHKVLATEAELAKLHLELTNASAMARHDPLTDALNRKGLDEVMTREIAALQRKGTFLSVALLDIDNFKRLNDRLGHRMGDAALVHLVRVVRTCMRTSDSLARYGGEEFVIVMPDTPIETAVTVMTRVQRQLTKDFFLADNEKILITFSAGIAQLAPGESQDNALERADEAMYLAKRSGKNRVIVG